MKLSLRSNVISLLPKSMKSLTNLKELYVEDNEIQDIPKVIGNLELERIAIQKNPLLKKYDEHMEKFGLEVNHLLRFISRNGS